jgi:cell division transport system permease protein
MWLSRQEIPLAEDASGPFLPWIVAVLVYLAALALAGAHLVDALTDRWQRSLTGALTVQVPPAEPGTEAAARTARLGRLVAALEARPEVAKVELLTPAEMTALLEPWLGQGAEVQDLPLPDLIAVTLVRGAVPDLESLNSDLQALAPGTSVDDHQRWLADVLRLAELLQVMAVVVLLLVVISAIVAVVFLTRTGLAVHRRVIELLHVIGAHDAYVARQFQIHALRLGLRGGVVGCALAVVTLLAFGAWFGAASSEAVPRLSLSIFGWGSLLLLPAATALVAMLTARVTVLRSLSRLP